MRTLLALLFISGILASCRSQQPQTQQPRGTQVGQSTAPLPNDPSVPNPPNEPDTNTSAPISQPPVQSPIPLTNDAGVSSPDPSAGDAGVTPPDNTQNPQNPDTTNPQNPDTTNPQNPDTNPQNPDAPNPNPNPNPGPTVP
jgi:hypothetical protein